jgi:hypothetical protein
MGDDGFSNELKNQIHRLAISDLLLHHEIVRSDVGDEVWYAAKLAEMPWSCVVEKGAWDFIYKHKLHIGGDWIPWLSSPSSDSLTADWTQCQSHVSLAIYI